MNAHRSTGVRILNPSVGAPGRAGWLPLVILLTAAGIHPAQSQERLLPVQLGRIYFSPSVTLSTGYDTNVERLSEGDPFIGPVASSIRDIQPVLRFDLPMAKNLVRLVYKGDFRQYSAEVLKNLGGMNHVLDLTGHIEAGLRLKVDFGAHYMDGITALLNSAPGGEYQYGTQPINILETRVGLSIGLGPVQSIELGAARVITQFDQTSNTATFYDYRQQDIYLHYVLDSGPQNQVFALLDVQDTWQGESLQSLQPDYYRTKSLGIGFRRITGRDLTSEMRVAYTSTDFQEALGTPFQGITLEAEVNLAPSPRTQAQIKLRRAPLVSFFNVSAYYLNEAAEINYYQGLGRSLGLRGSLGYQRNSYPDPILVTLPVPGGNLDGDNDGLIDVYENLLPSEGELRQDGITLASVGIVWHAGRMLDVNVGYRYQQARSNVVAVGFDNTNYHIYDYESRGVILAATLGWQ